MKTTNKLELFEAVQETYIEVNVLLMSDNFTRIKKKSLETLFNIYNFRYIGEDNHVTKYFNKFKNTINRLRNNKNLYFDEENDFYILKPLNERTSKTSSNHDRFRDNINTMNVHYGNFNRLVHEIKYDSANDNILFISVTPTNQEDFLNVEYEIDMVIRKNEKYKKYNIVHRTSIQKKYVDDYVQETLPDIIHFSGHSDERGFRLVKSSRHSDILTGEDINNILSKHNLIAKLIVFNSCKSVTLARDVSARRTESSIGTYSTVYDSVAIDFSGYFYENIFTIPMSFYDNYISAQTMMLLHIDKEKVMNYQFIGSQKSK